MLRIIGSSNAAHTSAPLTEGRLLFKYVRFGRADGPHSFLVKPAPFLGRVLLFIWANLGSSSLIGVHINCGPHVGQSDGKLNPPLGHFWLIDIFENGGLMGMGGRFTLIRHQNSRDDSQL